MKIGDKIHRLAPSALALLTYATVAGFVLGHLWRHPASRILADNSGDQAFMEWALTHAVRVVTHGDSPLFTQDLNAPFGVNLMANTSILGFGIPLSPVTWIFGVGVTFALITTLALAGTAAAWYYLLSRDLVRSRAAAFVGGLFCGFGPAMISQSTGHPNVAGQFMIPFIVRAVLRLREPGRPVRRGLVLAALVVYQSFLNEELLFLTALALGVFLLAYLPPREIIPAVRAALPAFGIAVLAAGAVLAYPLWFQFAGPQAYHGLPQPVLALSSDLASFKEFSQRSVVGDAARIARLGNITEQNTFFGWPLLLLLVAATVALWRQRVARAVVITGVVFGVLSLGSKVRYDGRTTSWSAPWQLLSKLPLFDSVVPTRLALVGTPLVGVLLALLVDRYIAAQPAPEPVEPASAPTPPARRRLPMRLLWAAALGLALLPLIPTPQPVTQRSGVPQFFSGGQWRDYLPRNATVVPLPGGWYEYINAMQWSTAADLDFRMVGGYFLAPDPTRTDGRGNFGPPYPPTLLLLLDVATTGKAPEVTAAQRTQARTDVADWRATNLVLRDQQANSDAIRQTVDQMFGPGRHVAGVWIWDVRSLT